MDETNELLICDEVWDDSPHDHAHQHNDCVDKLIHTTTNQDCKRMFDTYLRKEIKYMTTPGYVNFLESNKFVSGCRFKVIQWFIHSQSRLSFGIQSLFNAVNYVDRFIDINQCHSHLMMELLSLASLTIAIKYGETGPPKLHKIQEGLEYCFEARLIQKMGFKILECLNWEVNSTTPQSYVKPISWKLGSIMKPFAVDELSSSLNKILLSSLLDVKMLGYQPSVIFKSGLIRVLEDLYPSTYQEYFSHIAGFFPPDQKVSYSDRILMRYSSLFAAKSRRLTSAQFIQENLESCNEIIQQIRVTSIEPHAKGDPSIPDTILTREQVAIYEDQVDLSFIHGRVVSNKLKRKMKDDYNVKNKQIKCVH
ncbi:putative cyclin-D7-1 [Tanacetum coccineum]|uniref:Cyclin-D7-1 n=1 Tax=Tanacetum coccineum TaxID=301880 RepID=A0ABQ5HEG8_9ASTR